MDAETKLMLDKLEKAETLHDLKETITKEFLAITNNFKRRGYLLDFEQGLVGKHFIREEDFDIYQLYRDVHFVYWGVTKGNWNTFDPIETQYYLSLREAVEEIQKAIQ